MIRGARHALGAAVVAIGLVGIPLAADDWPGYLGPGRNGRSEESGLLRQWPDEGPRVLWRTPIGDGYSSVAVVAGRVFTMFAAEGAEWLAGFDAASGEELWRVRVGRLRRDSEGGGPRATPTVDGERVYAASASAQLVCVDAASGEELWSLDLAKELGARVPQWGVASSPLVEGDLLIVMGGGGKRRAFLALDKTSGDVVWSSGSELPGYGSPIVETIGGVRQAIFFTADGLVGVAVEDGEQLWKAPWKTLYDVNAATPVFVPANGLFISSGYDAGSMLVHVVREEGRFQAYSLWRNRVMRNHFNTSVRVGQHLYGYDESIFKCVDVLSGEEVWRGRAGSKGSLLYADGHLIVLSGNGELSLVEASAEAFTLKSRFRLMRERTWAAPALSEGVLYVRAWNELVALQVAGPPAG